MMESAKPIEAGCMAMVIRSDDSPQFLFNTVKVISYEGMWEFEHGVFPVWDTDLDNKDITCFVEPCLMRIDDPDIQDQIEEESRKTDKVYVRQGI